MNARHPRAEHELLAENLIPQLVDQRNLGKESMAPDIESIAFITDRARYAADELIHLQHGGFHTMLEQLVRGR